jgi:cysteine desulfuration protein SufE
MIEQKQQEIIEEFAFFEEWMHKYEHIIELGKEMKGLSDEEKKDDMLVAGCQSKVWLKASLQSNGTVHFEADSDAIITRGLVALVVGVFNEETPDDILKANIHFMNDIGLVSNLSQTRSNGLAAMVKQILLFATVFQAQQKSN